ncbi:Crp/Fnr family transcriptional regulator [Kitasatospora sp. NPDC059811]|uniref:Crp/Fnr family transcriptional regulator n=1 Tax=Streptomycetaceae TaxID=2062 RepID=UPI0007AF2C3A|nr:Crp/Fnr family transcriptional regulator [Streptomyces sp. MJM8645]
MSDTALGPVPDKANVLNDLFSEQGAGSAVRFRAGQTIMHQGDLSDHVMMLRTGFAKRVIRCADDAEIVLGLFEPSQVIGEQAALDGLPRSASVVALTDVTAVAVSGDAFRALIGTHPAAASAVLGILGERIREADQGRLELATRTVACRVAARLVALAPRIGAADEATGAVRLPLTQQDLAGWAGASREAVVRTLRRLRDEGVVTTERKTIIVHDLDALRVAAAS